MTRPARPCGLRIEGHLDGMNIWTEEWVTHGCVTLDLDPVDRGRSTVRGLGPKRYYVGLCIMLCGSGYFLEVWVKRGPPARVAQGSLVTTPGLVTCLCICCVRPRFMFRTLSLNLSWCMHVFLKISGVVAAPMCLDSLRLPG
ncbi:hypothetical protein M9H77_03707 [Catharanthus roseus]|uniref:Uncharacterized protein n=1 Tax=Catharanthus roseus TaxID=4058 RepID=A0ACC0CC69_CATRO|nr:hypothetical protein M9H77_03707 [Catharanthus roseus]